LARVVSGITSAELNVADGRELPFADGLPERQVSGAEFSEAYDSSGSATVVRSAQLRSFRWPDSNPRFRRFTENRVLASGKVRISASTNTAPFRT
jgi:hypothetical protein